MQTPIYASQTVPEWDCTFHNIVQPWGGTSNPSITSHSNPWLSPARPGIPFSTVAYSLFSHRVQNWLAQPSVCYPEITAKVTVWSAKRTPCHVVGACLGAIYGAGAARTTAARRRAPIWRGNRHMMRLTKWA